MKLFSIPNLFTLANLFCGIMSLLFLLRGFNIDVVLTLLVASLVLDFLDGFMARVLKSPSEIGKQLDSLADMVSFGVVPGVMMYLLLAYKLPNNNILSTYLPHIAFLIPLFSALRLAKFNIDEEQSTYFKGLNTPTNTVLIFSLFWINFHHLKVLSHNMDLYFFILLTLLSCFLLTSNIPMFSFKMKNLTWNTNFYKYTFLLISAILIILFQINAIPFIIALYIITSIIFRKKITHA